MQEMVIRRRRTLRKKNSEICQHRPLIHDFHAQFYQLTTTHIRSTKTLEISLWQSETESATNEAAQISSTDQRNLRSNLEKNKTKL